MLETFDHPNIVKYHCTVREDDTVWIVTEFMESKSVQHMLESFGNLDEALAGRYIAQALKGLEYLHDRRIQHKDIKSANILVSKCGLVKLADFGISVQLGPEEEGEGCANLGGSPYWMAPEIIEMATATTKSGASAILQQKCRRFLRVDSPPPKKKTLLDIWSVGCTVIEMVTGRPPYYHLSQIRAMFRMVHDAHPPLPQILPPASDGLQRFLMMCFQKNPSDRAEAKDLLRHPWCPDETSSIYPI